MANQNAAIAAMYKYFFLYIEPISALFGAYYSFFQQETYLELTHAPTAPKYGIPMSTQIVLRQLSNLYFLFAINEALVLRATSDLKVWRAVLFCLLVADLGHLYSVSILGSQIYWNISGWNAIDWGNVAFVYAGATMRICFLMGVSEAVIKNKWLGKALRPLDFSRGFIIPNLPGSSRRSGQESHTLEGLHAKRGLSNIKDRAPLIPIGTPSEAMWNFQNLPVHRFILNDEFTEKGNSSPPVN